MKFSITINEPTTRVEGPAAVDILQNFSDRWSHQTFAEDSHLVSLDSDFDLKAPGQEVASQGGPWTVQVILLLLISVILM